MARRSSKSLSPTPADTQAQAFNPPAAVTAARDLTLDNVPAQAALEIAEGARPAPEILADYGYDPSQIAFLLEHGPFVAQVMRYRSELERNGYTFKAKAAHLAEKHLDTCNNLIRDVNTPPVVRLDAIKFLARMGNLEPKEGATRGEGLTISINLGGSSAPITIDSTSSTTAPRSPFKELSP